MISNTSEIPMLQGADITLQMVKRPTNLRSRHVKVICTLGPACWEVSQLEKMIDEGMNVARFNFSHGDHEGHKACLDRLRIAAKKKSANVAVMLDTKGPEIRSGFLAGGAKKVSLTKGEKIVLTTDYSFLGDKSKLACSYPSLPKSVKPGQSILVADGSLVLSVLSCNESAGEVVCQIENSATIGERKNMNLPGVVVDLPTLTEKDIDDIVNFGVKHNVDFIAASFVRKASDVQKIRHVLSENNGQHIKVICKIENLEGLQNYLQILQATDAIMVARGDLGMEIPSEKVFLAQKFMIREANIAGKPVITATQMLESMIVNPRPTRAECSDVANACFDGTDCVMLSGETANGSNFEAAIKVMVRTCCEAEGSINFRALYPSVRNSVLKQYKMSAAESLASSAVKTSIDVGAKFLIVMSESGMTGRLVAKYRPGIPIAILTPSQTVARQCFGILRGCYTFVVDSLEDTDSLVEECSNQVRDQGVANDGDPFVVVCGKTFGHGATNQIRVLHVSSNYWDEPADVPSASSSRGVGRDLPGKHGCTIS